MPERPARRAYFPKATEDEYLEILRGYALESETLRDEFDAELKREIALIEQFPEAAPVVGRAVRRKVLRRFPYSLFYVIESDRLRVLAVAHHSRDPEYWRGRRSA